MRKDWPPNSFLSGVANLKTAWRDGNLYYQLDIPEYSPSKFVVRDGAKITLEFSDSDGFKLFEQEVPYSALTQRLDPGGVISGLSWAGDQYLNPDLYKRAAVVALLWRGIEKR